MSALPFFARCVQRAAAWLAISGAAALIPAAFAPAAAQTTLTMGIVGKGQAVDWALYLGQKKGFFAEHGVKLDLMSAPSASAVIQWVTAGSTVLGASGMADPIVAIDKGAKIALLRTETEAAPYALQTRDSTKTIADLRGKTVSVGGNADITRVYFEKMAEPAGLKSGDYDLVYAGSTAARFAALQSGAADAAMLLPPFFFKPVPGFHTLVLVGDVVKDLPFTSYTVNAEWGRAHKEEVKGFLAGVARSIDWLLDPANREEAIAILIAESGAERGDVEQIYDLYRKINAFSRAGVLDEKLIGRLAGALKALGKIDNADPARFLDPELSSLAAAYR
jgi:ABC-type nitrate/sulfonate/bicarbonate transport system substrate-binding protein